MDQYLRVAVTGQPQQVGLLEFQPEGGQCSRPDSKLEVTIVSQHPHPVPGEVEEGRWSI